MSIFASGQSQRSYYFQPPTIEKEAYSEAPHPTQDGIQASVRDFTGIDLNGNIYTGESINGHPHGHGLMAYALGSCYKGSWVNGSRTGEGVETYADHSKTYVGSWLNDKKHGNGKETRSDGYIYEGMWANGLPNGLGKCINERGHSYEGSWIDGKKEGQGRMTYRNGEVYEGTWVNGKKHGKGMGIDKNMLLVGEWFEDKMTQKTYHDYWTGLIIAGRSRAPKPVYLGWE